MEKIKISIITPVYMVEKYICRCLDSILTQSLKDIEIICIDDDSPDNCPQILDSYAQKDSRVKVIHKKNEGQGVARNLALSLAVGEYVLFVDSDDWIEPEALMKIYTKIKSDDSDVLFFNVIRNFEKRDGLDFYRYIDPYYIKFGEKVFHPLEAKEVLYKTSAHPFKIYKRESLEKYKFKYSEIRVIEDHLPYFCFLANCERISVLNDFIYNYTVRPNSTTFNCEKYIHDIFKSFYECEREFIKTKYGKELMNQFLEKKIVTFFYYSSLMPFLKAIIFYGNLKKVLKYIINTYGIEYIPSNLSKRKINHIIKYPYFIYQILNRLFATKIMMGAYKY